MIRPTSSTYVPTYFWPPISKVYQIEIFTGSLFLAHETPLDPSDHCSHAQWVSLFLLVTHFHAWIDNAVPYQPQSILSAVQGQTICLKQGMKGVSPESNDNVRHLP